MLVEVQSTNMCRALDYCTALLDAGQMSMAAGSPFVEADKVEDWGKELQQAMFSGLQLYLASLNGLVDQLKVSFGPGSVVQYLPNVKHVAQLCALVAWACSSRGTLGCRSGEKPCGPCFD